MSLARALDLTVSLTSADVRARYGRGRCRLLKWLLDPIALVGVYLVLVALVFDRAGRAPGLSLACAIVPFQLVMSTTVNAFDALEDRRGVIANMAFPKTLVPITSALTETVAFGASLVLLVVMMAVYGVAPTTALLWLPLVLLTTIALAVAIAFPAALLGVWVWQLREFVVSFVRTLYFVAPGLVALSQIHGHVHELVKINPMTGLFEAYRSVLLYGQAPAAWEIAFPLAAAVLVAAIFVPLFQFERHHLVKAIA